MANYKYTISLDGDTSELQKQLKDIWKQIGSTNASIGLTIDGKDATKQFNDIWAKIEKNMSKGKLNLSDIVSFGNFVTQLDNADQSIKTLQSSMGLLVTLAKTLGEAKLGQVFDPVAKKLDTVIDKLAAVGQTGGLGSGVGASVEQLDKVVGALDRIESHLSGIEKAFSDAGDGEEFSPLLRTLKEIEEAIARVEIAASNIKLDFNLDLGDQVSERLNQKISQATTRQLNAYRKLFEAMKSTGKLNKEMINFYEPDDASPSELIGMYQGMIKRAEEQYKTGRSNAYKQKLGSTYDELKKEIKNSTAQLGRAENKQSKEGILSDLFGDSKDISVVVEQLDRVIERLDSISKSAINFTEVFKTKFSLEDPLEDVTSLIERIQTLEEELTKLKARLPEIPVEPKMEPATEAPTESDKRKPIKTAPTIKNTVVNDVSAIDQQNKLQEELKETENRANKTAEAESTAMAEVATKTDKATESQERFNEAQGRAATSMANYLDQIDRETHTYDPSALKGRDIISQGGLKETYWAKDKDGEYHEKGMFSFVERLKDGQLQNILVKYDEETQQWYENTESLSTAFEKVGSEIISLDDQIAKYEMNRDKQKAANPTYDTSADEKLITLAKDRQAILLETLQTYSNEKKYAYEISEFEKKQLQNQERLNALKQKQSNELQAKQDTKDQIKIISDERKRQAEITKTNRLLNRQKIIAQETERTYDQKKNPDLDKSVSNVTDLKELESKKQEILDLINKLTDKVRDSSTEKDFLKLEQLMSEYRQMAKDKLKSNNPTKQELGQQDLKVSIAQLIGQYDELIAKAKTYGNEAADTVTTLEEQRKILTATNDKGEYTATATQFNDARDTYKIEKAGLVPLEINQKEAKKVVTDLTQALSKYEALQTKIAKGNALEGDQKEAEKLLNTIHELQRSDVLPYQELNKSNEKLKQIRENVEEINRKKLTDFSEKSAKKLSAAISNYDYGDSTEAQKLLQKFKNGPIGNLDQADSTIKKYSTLLDEVITKLVKSHKEQEKSLSEEIKLDNALKKTQVTLDNLDVPDELKSDFDDLKKDVDELNRKLQSQEDKDKNFGLDDYRAAVKKRAKKFNDKKSQQSLRNTAITDAETKLSNASKDGDYGSLETKVKSLIDQLKNGKVEVKAFKQEIASLFSDYRKEVNKSSSSAKTMEDTIAGFNDRISKLSFSSVLTGEVEAQKNKLAALDQEVREGTKTLDQYKVEAQQIVDTLKDWSKLGRSDVGKTGINTLAEAKTAIQEYINKVGTLKGAIKGTDVADASGITTWTAQIVTASGEVQNLAFKWSDSAHTLITTSSTVKTELTGVAKAWDALKKKTSDLILYWTANFANPYQIIGGIKQIVNVSTELDAALTEMRKVSDESVQSLKDYQKTTFATAKAVGTTAKQIQDSTADFMRLGESMKQAAESSRVTNLLLNVSEFDNIDDATQSLISMGQAYKDLDKITIVDKLNEIGNNYAISTDELATSLQKSAATLSLMGNTIDEAAALVTTANATIQDADSVSAGIRTISLRLVGSSEAENQLEALGEEVDAFVAQTESKKQQIIKDYTAVASNNYKGFDILDENGNYKNTYEILLGIAKVYKEIQEQDKKLGTNNAVALVEELAGKNRSNIASAILQDPEQLEAVKKSSEEAFGSAEEELNKYLDSIEGKTQQFTNQWQELAATLGDTDMIKNAISAATSFLSVITNLIKNVGGLSAALGVLGGIGIPQIFNLDYATYNIRNYLQGSDRSYCYG